jgi:L-ascorbate metabolism protein UlaG (beta-lactamase superfamily)
LGQRRSHPDAAFYDQSSTGKSKMGKTTTIISALIALLATGLAAQGSTNTVSPSAPQRPPLDVTYIANEGFLIQAGGKKVLVDALFDGQTRYLGPSPELLAQMTGGSGFFADVDLLLVTHRHGDHFNPMLVAEFLRNHARCRLVAHTQVVDLLRKEEGFARIEGQIHEVRLEPGSRENMTINGIALDVLGLDHVDDTQTRDLAFIVNLGGTRFLHLGDATVENSLAYLNAYPFDATPVDVLFLEYFDRFPATQQFIAEKIKPSRIVAMHIPPAELEEESKSIRAAYPHAVVFKQSMERRSIPIGVDFHNLTGEYFGQTPPGATPKVFARGIVSTEYQDHGPPSFSPDGNEVFWREARRPGPDNKEWEGFNMTMRRKNGRWSAPFVDTRFDGRFFLPVFSADGRKAYFSSARPGSVAAQASRTDFDIWFVEKRGDDWGEPKCLNLVARYPELRWAGFPSMISIARNGTLYFMGYTLGPLNDYGIFRSELVNGEYAKPDLLPRSINLPPFLNWEPFIAPDESYLLFSSNRRDPDHDAGDLYISRRQSDGSWTDPVSLGEPINSPSQERLPGVSRDGKYLFFTRWTPDHGEDVFWENAASITALRSIITPSQENPK